MNQEDLVRVIAEPARRGKWQLVEGLVEQIIEDVGARARPACLCCHTFCWKRGTGAEV